MSNNNANITEKLDKIIQLLAAYLTKDQKGDEQIQDLHNFGLSRQEISKITRKELNTVDQALYRIKQNTKLSKQKGVKNDKKTKIKPKNIKLPSSKD